MVGCGFKVFPGAVLPVRVAGSPAAIGFISC